MMNKMNIPQVSDGYLNYLFILNKIVIVIRINRRRNPFVVEYEFYKITGIS